MSEESKSIIVHVPHRYQWFHVEEHYGFDFDSDEWYIEKSNTCISVSIGMHGSKKYYESNLYDVISYVEWCDSLKESALPETNEIESTNVPECHDKHYKNGLYGLDIEPIEVMESMMVANIHEEHHQTVLSNFRNAMMFKYQSRLGKKDDVKKEIAKIRNWAERLLTGKWINEN